MNKKWAPLVILLFLGLAVIAVNFLTKKEENETSKEKAKEVNRNNGFDRRVEFLEYSKHAMCRMDCRRISEEEVKDIMQNGKINYKKSEIKTRKCPRYALEGTTADNQKVRIVFAQCDFKTVVVTVIDLKTDWECACPGD